MKKLTKQEQKDEALEAYIAIQAPALKVYLAKCDEIEQQEDDDIRIIDGKRYKLIEEK